MSLEDDKQRAWKAKELLENELLQQSLSAIKSEIVQGWESCPARDKEGKEYYWQLIQMANKFELILKGYIQAGESAESMIRHKESVIDKIRRII